MDEEVKVTWLELFYDLAFVAIVAQLTYAVAAHHASLSEFLIIIFVSYMIFVSWINTTMSRNVQVSENTEDKILLQLQVIGALVMGIGLPGMFAGDVTTFFLGFLFVRMVQLFIAFRFNYLNPSLIPKTQNVLQSRVLATILWITATMMTIPYLYVVAGMALALDILGALTVGKGNPIAVKTNVNHLQERFGLFLILVLGESVLIVSLSNPTILQGSNQPVIVFAGLVMAISLWWAYFSHLDTCALAKRPHNIFVYLNAHAFLFVGVVLFAAAFKLLLKHDTLLLPDLLLLIVGVSVVAFALTVIRLMFRDENRAVTRVLLGMIVGIPVIGVLAYQSHSTPVAVSLVAGWVVLWAIYDEWKRTHLFKYE